MSIYRFTKSDLFNELAAWDSIIKKKIHLIACGGTALTLLDIKESTKDVDFIVPDIKEYKYLINILTQIGYKTGMGTSLRKDNSPIILDIYAENRIHTTELLESPLKKKNHYLLKEYDYIYLGVLNYYDIIISKLFRASSVDFEDCIMLEKNKSKEIDIEYLKKRFLQTSSYDISEEKNNRHLNSFLTKLKKEGIING